MTLFFPFAALMTLSEFLTWITLMSHVFLSMITGQADGCPRSSKTSSSPVVSQSLVTIPSLFSVVKLDSWLQGNLELERQQPICWEHEKSNRCYLS